MWKVDLIFDFPSKGDSHESSSSCFEIIPPRSNFLITIVPSKILTLDVSPLFILLNHVSFETSFMISCIHSIEKPIMIPYHFQSKGSFSESSFSPFDIKPPRLNFPTRTFQAKILTLDVSSFFLFLWHSATYHDIGVKELDENILPLLKFSWSLGVFTLINADFLLLFSTRCDNESASKMGLEKPGATVKNAPNSPPIPRRKIFRFIPDELRPTVPFEERFSKLPNLGKADEQTTQAVDTTISDAAIYPFHFIIIYHQIMAVSDSGKRVPEDKDEFEVTNAGPYIVWRRGWRCVVWRSVWIGRTMPNSDRVGILGRPVYNRCVPNWRWRSVVRTLDWKRELIVRRRSSMAVRMKGMDPPSTHQKHSRHRRLSCHGWSISWRGAFRHHHEQGYEKKRVEKLINHSVILDLENRLQLCLKWKFRFRMMKSGLESMDSGRRYGPWQDDRGITYTISRWPICSVFIKKKGTKERRDPITIITDGGIKDFLSDT